MGSLRYFKRCGGAHLHQRAAAPLPRVQLTAGGARRTAAGVVTLHIPQHAPLHGPLLGEPGQALEPRGGAGLGAGGCAGVAGVADGAAVFPVSTAHRLGGGGYESFSSRWRREPFTILHYGDFEILSQVTYNHSFTHRRRSQPRRATASSPGAVRAR